MRCKREAGLGEYCSMTGKEGVRAEQDIVYKRPFAVPPTQTVEYYGKVAREETALRGVQ